MFAGSSWSAELSNEFLGLYLIAIRMRGQTQRLKVTGYFPKRPKLTLDDFGPLPATFHLPGVIVLYVSKVRHSRILVEIRSLRVIISLAGQSSPFVQMQIPNVVGSSFQASGKLEAEESNLQEGQPLRKKCLACSNGISPYHPGRWQSKKVVRLRRRLQA